MSDNHTRNFQDVLDVEHQHIKSSRERAQMPTDVYTAFAISGGGIRSATFALGVMQALVAANILKKMDYMSTSSGGGYIGSALTWLLRQGLDKDRPAGVEADNFPLGRARASSTNAQNWALNFIRMHGNYLTPTADLNGWSLLGLIFRTSLISLLAYFTLLSTLMLFPMSIGVFQPITWLPALSDTPLKIFLHNYCWFATLVIIVLFLIQCVWFAVFSGMSLVSTTKRYIVRTRAQRRLGTLLALCLLSFLLGTIPWIHQWSLELILSLNMTEGYAVWKQNASPEKADLAGKLQRLQGVVAAISACIGSLMGFIHYVKARRGTAGANNSFVIFIAAALILYGLGFAAFVFNLYIATFSTARWFFLAGGIVAVVFGFFVNSNYLGLHRMYRDRLMEAFLPDQESIARNQWDMAQKADATMLDLFCQAPNERPFHLINTNLVLSDSQVSKYHSRGGDSFVLSPLFSGSDATGWVKTCAWQRKPDDKKASTGISLASAMAVSGASVNPNAGNSGRGPTRSKLVSTLLTLLNIRLGYWVINPQRVYQRWFKPNLIYPGLNGSLFGPGLHESQTIVELSDGGHFDNLGLYELIRRKVKLIILSDAGADGTYCFDDLGNAVEKARVDFGVHIRFSDEYSLDNLQPGSATKNSEVSFDYAKHSFAVAAIEYPDTSHGRLIYVKATLIDGLPADVYNYKKSNPAFPHEPTADQFFSEVQIEAYRELGYQLTWDMLNKNGIIDGDGNWTPERYLDTLKS
ncbi:MAG: hypothetical protein RL497_1740 [Pseudomonadota bacterium]|jgi:hypothetical protein